MIRPASAKAHAAPFFYPRWRYLPGVSKTTMKAYIITTGIIFALITVLHIWKAVAEGPGTAKNPLFIVLTLLTTGLSVWAFRLLMSSRRA
jgi:hypothetical protein